MLVSLDVLIFLLSIAHHHFKKIGKISCKMLFSIIFRRFIFPLIVEDGLFIQNASAEHPANTH